MNKTHRVDGNFEGLKEKRYPAYGKRNQEGGNWARREKNIRKDVGGAFKTIKQSVSAVPLEVN
jgi:hypothetical protein